MLTNKFSSASSLLTGIFFIVLGALFFTEYSKIWTLIYILFMIGFLWIGLNQILRALNNKQKASLNLSTMLTSLLCVGLAVYTFFNPGLFFKFIHYVIGWWALLNAAIQFINFYVYRRDCLKGTYVLFLKGLADAVFAAMLMLKPINKLWIVAYIAGAYLIFYGGVTVLEALKDLLSAGMSVKIREHLRISIPVLISAIIPQRFFLSINALIKTNKLNPDAQVAPQASTDLEVFIYLKESGPESLGHVDISFQGKIYSYGCHDPHHRGLFGTLGDGVLVVSDRETFLKHALKSEDKTIISYGLTLNESQKAMLQKRIDAMMERAYTWRPDAQLLAEGETAEGEAKDYASRVWNATHAHMYKFANGKFKTYFVFSTNCVLLADELLHCKELDLIPIGGIVTPGTYLEFLNTEYLRPGGMVVERTIYKRTRGKGGEHGSSFGSSLSSS
ncbi:HdeD family acid-resistance protein [Holdemania filiformis]|uniref:DUF308 domain-containing protein n=1 Tax=Holdemania filiformis TaxID=61171 RepID=A0A412FW66_9FIRM|nr:DUF308 domain-containing protein [Holdemania filiformis]MBS5001471.1 DUF308 domain-containing protein [Holdemania filiformis]RGR72397.1 hypothetical protein DWY25_12135 [Holdemania filiformis]